MWIPWTSPYGNNTRDLEFGIYTIFDENNKIYKQYITLSELGYDCHIVFVNTSLDVAQQRNSERDRSLDATRVESYWKLVQQNIGKFQNLFGSDHTLIVDNNNKLEGKDLQEFGTTLYRAAFKMFNSPIKKPRGNYIINALKQIGGLYLADLKQEHIDKLKSIN